MKKIKLLIGLAALLSLVGKSVLAAETITVAATKYPNGEILEQVVKPLLAKQGYSLKVQLFPSYNDQQIADFFRMSQRAQRLDRKNPNFEVIDGKADANFFQHPAYLEKFSDNFGNQLHSVEGVFYVPYAVYASKTERAELANGLTNLHNGAMVYISDSTINQERTLRFLEQLHLIELKKSAGYLRVSDISSNPRQLKIVPVDEVLLPTLLERKQADIVVMNSGQAASKGIAFSQAIASEARDEEYENILVTKKDNLNTPKMKALAEALHSPEVKAYIKKTYHGEVIPVF